MNAVITAGGRVKPPLSMKIGTTVKALAVVGGTTMLERAIAAARKAGAQRVAVVGGDEVRAACGALIDRFIAEGTTGAENVQRALSVFTGDLLYLTSDLPFLSGSALNEFVTRVPRGTIAMPLADARAYERRFPHAPTHATVIGDERLANGSAFFIPAGAAPKIAAVAQRLFNARKSLFAMATLLGPRVLVKFALHRLSIADIESRAARALGVPALAVRDCAPELCYDIDDLEDYEYACARH